MRWRGINHVEFAVLDYDASIEFYDAMFGWLGYDSFSSLNMEYQSIYYFTRYINPHSYIGIQPARTGERLTHSDQAVGVNHIALWPAEEMRSTASTANSCLSEAFSSPTNRRSTRSTGRAISRCSSTTRSTGSTGS